MNILTIGLIMMLIPLLILLSITVVYISIELYKDFMYYYHKKNVIDIICISLLISFGIGMILTWISIIIGV